MKGRKKSRKRFKPTFDTKVKEGKKNPEKNGKRYLEKTNSSECVKDLKYLLVKKRKYFTGNKKTRISFGIIIGITQF